jgi:hypothetical protein
MAHHFRDGIWTPIRVIRDGILKQVQGERVFFELLRWARELGSSGLETLKVARDGPSLDYRYCYLSYCLNEMRRLTEATRPKALDGNAFSLPTLSLEPTVDCSRYASLR